MAIKIDRPFGPSNRLARLAQRVQRCLFDAKPGDPRSISFGIGLGGEIPPIAPIANPAAALFSEKIKAIDNAPQVIELLHSEVMGNYRGNELLPFIKIVMKKARWFAVEQHDLTAAFMLWSAVRNIKEIRSDTNVVLHSILAAAKALCDPLRPPSELDLDQAIKLWQTAFDSEQQPDEKLKSLNSMNWSAKKLTDEGKGPAAIKLWQAAFNLSSDPWHKKIIYTDMLHYAVKNIYSRTESALPIWEVLLLIRPEKKELLCEKLQRYASRMVSSLRFDAEKKIANAINIWNLVYQNYSLEREKFFVIIDMMKATHAMTDIEGHRSTWNIDGAIKIWVAAFALNHSRDQNSRIIGTIIAVALKLGGPDTPMDNRDYHYARRLRTVAEELRARLG